MREGMQLGYNILYASGDSLEKAVIGLTGIMREAHERYEVELVGGLQVKDDAKNRFNVAREVILKEKPAGASPDYSMLDAPAPAPKPTKKAKS